MSPDGGFLQSDDWANFQISAGHEFFHEENQNGWANIFEQKVFIGGSYGYIPRGPIFCSNVDKSFIQGIVQLAKKCGWSWIRLEPRNDRELSDYQSLGFNLIKAPHNVQPKEIFLVDLKKESEEILNNMKSKTRYNIRLAEKKGIKIRVSRDDQKVERFLDLIEMTASRDGIVSHPRAYYKKMLEKISEPMLKLYLAEFQGEILAGALVSRSSDVSTYLHGASSDNQRELMAPYLIQWQAMREAKACGASFYDLGGVALKEKNSRWKGITRFKVGFSPKSDSIIFPGSYDLIISPFRYKIYRLLQPLGRLKKFL